MSKPRRKSNRSSRQDREREFTVVLEDLRAQFRTFGEGLSGLERKVDGLSAQLAQKADKSDFELLKMAQLATNAKIERLEMAQQATNSKIEQFEIAQQDTNVKLDRFFNILSDHETRISSIENSA